MTINVDVEPATPLDAVDVPLPATPTTSQHEINVLRFGNSQGRMWLGELNTIRWAWDKQVALWKDDIAQNPERWTVEALMETVEAFGDMFIKETSE